MRSRTPLKQQTRAPLKDFLWDTQHKHLPLLCTKWTKYYHPLTLAIFSWHKVPLLPPLKPDSVPHKHAKGPTGRVTGGNRKCWKTIFGDPPRLKAGTSYLWRFSSVVKVITWQCLAGFTLPGCSYSRSLKPSKILSELEKIQIFFDLCFSSAPPGTTNCG